MPATTTTIVMPKMGFDMQEGTLVRWLKKPGDRVERGEAIAEIETDKAVVSVEAFESGVIQELLIEEGQTLPVGQPIATLAAGEGAAAAPEAPATPAANGAPAHVPTKESVDAPAGHRPGYRGREAGFQPVQRSESALVAEELTGAARQPAGQEAAARPEPPPARGVVAQNPAATAPLTATTVPATAAAPAATVAPAAPAAGAGPAPEGRRVKASPMARKLARELGVDLATVRGTGPGGRILKADVEQAAAGVPAGAGAEGAAPARAARTEVPAGARLEARPEPQPPPQPVQQPASMAAAASREGFEARPKGEVAQATPTGGEPAQLKPFSRMRLAIARRMSTSKREAPHFYVTVNVDMAEALELRLRLNDSVRPQADAAASREGETSGRHGDGTALPSVRVSVNDLILKAAAMTLPRYPELNAALVEGGLQLFEGVHIAVAVALEEGLLTPVIRDCDRKSLRQIAAESRQLIEEARSGRLTPESLADGTFTVSNLGMFDVDLFSAILNPPQTAILAVGSVQQRPVVRDGQIVAAPMMSLTLSADHRATDGAQVARFLNDLREVLEHPYRMLA